MNILKDTLQALRDSLEKLKFDSEKYLQSLHTSTRAEIGQLEDTIKALRTKLEKSTSGKTPPKRRKKKS